MSSRSSWLQNDRVRHTRDGARLGRSVVAVLLAASCQGPPSVGKSGATTTSTTEPAPSVAPPPVQAVPTVPCGNNRIHVGRTPPDPLVLRALETGAFRAPRLDGRVLFAWVSSPEVALLRTTRTLLDHTRAPGGVPFPFDRRRMRQASTIGALFDQPALAKRLLAWPNPWGALPGNDRRTVRPRASPPDRLVRIVLRPDAWLASFDAGGVWSFHDLQGSSVDEADVSRGPGRIAAVLHGFSDEHGLHREILLCNERMIEEWAMDTEDLRAEVGASLDLLRRLRDDIAIDPKLPPLPPPGSEGACGGAVEWVYDEALVTAYDANLASVDRAHALGESTIDAFRDALADLPAGGPPLRHRPGAPTRGSGD